MFVCTVKYLGKYIELGAKNDYDWYKERRKWVGDLHGQAGMLWCAYALIEPAK